MRVVALHARRVIVSRRALASRRALFVILSREDGCVQHLAAATSRFVAS